MGKLFRFLLIMSGLLTLTTGAIALAVTLLPDLPQSQALRSAVAGAVQRWAISEDASMQTGEQAAPDKKRLYQCSMHPQIISDKPDLCPICQMRLEPVEGEEHATSGEAKARKPMLYRHPMRPDVTSPNPGKDEMGMDYIPVYEDDGANGTSDVPGHAPFKLSTERQQLIGVRRSKVERRDLNLEIRAVGKVAHDPDLYQAIVEYQEALAGKRRIAASQSPDAHAGADAIVRSSALKLRQLGLSEQQLRQFAEDSRPPVNLLLPGKSVWVYAQVYEYEVELVRAGQPVTLTAPSQPGRSYTARVAAVDPILTAATRTARVRVEVATPDSTLRPETFVHVKILVPSENQIALPEEAVLNTGEHQIVFVVSGEGSFEPRSVKLGRLAEGYYEVVSGLSEGEEVVTSANFLIDSESRFRSAVAAFSKNAAPAAQPASPMQ